MDEDEFEDDDPLAGIARMAGFRPPADATPRHEKPRVPGHGSAMLTQAGYADAGHTFDRLQAAALGSVPAAPREPTVVVTKMIDWKAHNRRMANLATAAAADRAKALPAADADALVGIFESGGRWDGDDRQAAALFRRFADWLEATADGPVPTVTKATAFDDGLSVFK